MREKRIKEKHIIIPVILFLCSVAILSCHKKALTEKEIFYGDSLIISDFIFPTGINPLIVEHSISSNLRYLVFDSLLGKNGNNYEPRLARTWKVSEDRKSLEFFLRKGIKFHDGVEFTSEDVRFTYELFEKTISPNLDAEVDKNSLQNIVSIEILNPYLIRFVLKKPSKDFFETASIIGILPSHIYKNVPINNFDNSPLHFHPIGTGAFKLTKWSKEEIILAANKEYFLGRPNLEKIIAKFYPNKEIAWAKIISGEADFFYLYPENYQFVASNPNIKIYSFLDNYFYLLALNNKNVILNKEIRKALNYSINRDEIIKIALLGHGKISKGSIHPSSVFFDKTTEPYPYNPSLALELLKKNGWEDRNGDHFLDKKGEKFSLSFCFFEADEPAEKIALIIQKQLLDLGIDMEIKPLDINKFYEIIFRKKQYDAAIVPFTIDVDRRLFHSNPVIATHNIFNYSNPKIDKFLEQIENTEDVFAKKRLYKEFQMELKEDPPGVFLFWRETLVALDKRFAGVDIGPDGILKNVRNWYVPKEKQKYK